MKMRASSAIALILPLLAYACFYGRDATDINFVIGVAQANLSEPWREVMNAEILEAASTYPGVRIIFTNAGNRWEKQEEDIRKLMQSGVDLLIVSPVESREIAPAIREAYARKPVIILDKAIEGYDYTLYVGADNYLVGKQAARFVKQYFEGGEGSVIEITGSADSLPVTERMRGFREELEGSGNIKLAASFSADWLRDRAQDITEEYLALFRDSAFIFAHNDAMAYGIHRGLAEAGITGKAILGIDGLSGPEGGLALVEDGILEATITCPTGGKEALIRAMDILQRRDGLPKKIFLRSSLITRQILAEKRASTPRVLSRRPDAPIVLGYAQTGRESAWREANTKSIISAAKESGVTLLFRDAGLIQANQIAAIREFIRAGVDVIAFSPLVENGWDEVLYEAKAAGIPVICSDRSVAVADETLVTTYLVADFIEEGRRAAQWVLDNTRAETEVRIVEIKGLVGSAPTIGREKGFAQVIGRSAAHAIIDSEVGDFIDDLGYSAMTQLLLRHGRIDVVYAHNDDMALGAIRAIKEFGLKPGKDILIVSIDGVKAAFQAMVKGELNCSVECSPLLGPQLMKAVIDYVNGEDLPLRINTAEGVFPSDRAKELIASRPY
jgi:galactofuranose transport system substrate-binding protein